MTPDPYLLTSLWAEDTGVPLVVWIAISPGYVQSPRLYISRHKKPSSSDDFIEVMIEPDVRVEGAAQIEKGDLDLLRRWIEVGRVPILRHWNGENDSIGLVRELSSLSE